MAALTTALIAAFIPEQSPPLVNTAIRFMSASSRSDSLRHVVEQTE